MLVIYSKAKKIYKYNIFILWRDFPMCFDINILTRGQNTNTYVQKALWSDTNRVKTQIKIGCCKLDYQVRSPYVGQRVLRWASFLIFIVYIL